MQAITKADTADMRELISFEVRDQAFCVDIHCVREIRGWSAVTPMPQAPSFVCGIVNLRGTMLPIVDLGDRLGYGRTVASARHAIIVVQGGHQLLGLLVDGVSEILSVDAAGIQVPPTLGSEYADDMVCGMLPAAENIITILGVDNIIGSSLPQAA
jgi:purine-binding chemotaxis protein CheW